MTIEAPKHGEVDWKIDYDGHVGTLANKNEWCRQKRRLGNSRLGEIKKKLLFLSGLAMEVCKNNDEQR